MEELSSDYVDACYDRDRYKAALEMIAQFISGNVRAIRSIALAALKGADVRNLDEVEKINGT